MFPTEESATKWLEETRWPEDRPCPRCGDCNTYRIKSRKPMPFRCRGCWKFFSVRIGTVMERSHISLQNWVWAIYLSMTSLKGVSSMKLHRDLGITQKTAWFLAHRLRDAMMPERSIFAGPVEADESYFGGKRKNMPLKKRKAMTGPGTGWKDCRDWDQRPAHESGPSAGRGRHQGRDPETLPVGPCGAGDGSLHGRLGCIRLPGEITNP